MKILGLNIKFTLRNSIKNFAELEIVGREWEAEMAKSRIKGRPKPNTRINTFERRKNLTDKKYVVGVRPKQVLVSVQCAWRAIVTDRRQC